MSNTTCWTVVKGAANGNKSDRELFAERYTPVVRACLGARWRDRHLLAELDDAVQDVFVDCFRETGALQRVDPDRGVPFRAFLRGVVRNVARRYEERQARARERQVPLDFDAASDEARFSTLFDQAWARSIMREAADRHAREAAGRDASATRRVELLRLRFHEEMPIGEIAALWNADAAVLHREYAKARREFRSVLAEVVAFHHPGSAEDIERECADLLALLAGQKT